MITLYIYCSGLNAGLMKADGPEYARGEVSQEKLDAIVKAFREETLLSDPVTGIIVLTGEEVIMPVSTPSDYVVAKPPRLKNAAFRPATLQEIFDLLGWPDGHDCPVVPNLYNISDEELDEFTLQLVQPLRTFQLLHKFAINVMLVREARKNKFIEIAQTIEKELDKIYKKLPRAFRW